MYKSKSYVHTHVYDRGNEASRSVSRAASVSESAAEHRGGVNGEDSDVSCHSKFARVDSVYVYICLVMYYRYILYISYIYIYIYMYIYTIRQRF